MSEVQLEQLLEQERDRSAQWASEADWLQDELNSAKSLLEEVWKMGELRSDFHRDFQERLAKFLGKEKL